VGGEKKGKRDGNNERIWEAIYTGPEMTNPTPTKCTIHDAVCKTCFSPCSISDSEGIAPPPHLPPESKGSKINMKHACHESSSHVATLRPSQRLQFAPHADHLPWRLVMGCIIIFYAPKLAELQAMYILNWF
jgi:hypothetical protein